MPQAIVAPVATTMAAVTSAAIVPPIRQVRSLSSADLTIVITAAHQRSAGFGPGHPDTLTARANLARWTGEAGDPAAARDQYAALLPAIERVCGPEHPATLTARANLAYWTRQADNTRE